jgi:predicted dehydrogenase
MQRRGFVLGALSAAAYARIAGANDRLRIAVVGPGAQGTHLIDELYQAAAGQAEVVAVCDLWSKRREDAAGLCAKLGGAEPRKLERFDDVLAMKDVDGVMIATPDHQHARQLVKALAAKKDVYCEKPMGNVLPDAKAAFHAIKASTQVVQLGTQGLSTGGYQAAAAFVRTGKLGKVSRVTHEASFNGPRWRPRPEVKEIREQDTDWKAWLAGRPARPFDPQLYFEFRCYREFSNGIADQWLTHAIAGVHHVMDDYFPTSVVASGSVLVHKDGRESSDTFGATLLYPKGWLFQYGAMFGNDFPGASRYFGENGTIERVGEGGKYVVRGLGGGTRPTRLATDTPLEPVNPTSHVKNWLDCMKSRQTPNADALSGFAHSVVSIMAAQSERTGRKLYWDRKREEIVDRPVA